MNYNNFKFGKAHNNMSRNNNLSTFSKKQSFFNHSTINKKTKQQIIFDKVLLEIKTI
jgi:hypothetical protein